LISTPHLVIRILVIQDAARNWVACRRGGGLSDPLDLRPWCPKSVSSASPTSKVVGSYVSTLLGSAGASYESFRIDFLICQLEDINPKGLTLITMKISIRKD
jgi:hypothetical protein